MPVASASGHLVWCAWVQKRPDARDEGNRPRLGPRGALPLAGEAGRFVTAVCPGSLRRSLAASGRWAACVGRLALP